VRIDTGVEQGADISPYYDPMIAKMIAHGPTREDARASLAAALDRAVIWPLRTNAAFLVKALDHPSFRAGSVDTGLIARAGDALMPDPLPGGDALARAAARLGGAGGLAGFRLNAAQRTTARILVDGQPVEVEVAGGGAELFGDPRPRILVTEHGQSWDVRPFRVTPRAGSAAGDGAILSPMPGRVIAVEVQQGQRVEKGRKLVTLEAMKMEHSLVAPFDGIVDELAVEQGAQVQEGTLLVRIIEDAEA
jgi:3-methylcrotonyl-CoA carboxylase alpha subunit